MPSYPYGVNTVAFRMLLGPGATTPNYNVYAPDVGLVSATTNAFQTAQRFNVGYYNSGFLSGLGGVLKSVGPYIAAAGSIAAEVLPAIYHTGTSGATQTPAAGPTAAPVMAKPAMHGTSLVQKVENVLDPAFLGGPSHAAARMGRYAPAGTKGYHPVKKGPHVGLWVRNRHRNVANIHALRRSLSRIHGFEKICRKVVHFVHPKRAIGHAVFKRRKRS